MTLKVGDSLPDAAVIRATTDGPQQTTIADLTKGRKVVLFAVPGAFTPTCDSAHLPSFIRTADQFAAKGIDEILCLSVNDAFVMSLWGTQSGAHDAGIAMISDPEAAFTKAVGMAFTAPPVGLIDRSRRYAMVVEDGVVQTMHVDEPGTCALTSGEAILDLV